jgi:hypothetical protein
MAHKTQVTYRHWSSTSLWPLFWDQRVARPTPKASAAWEYVTASSWLAEEYTARG